MRTEAPSEQDRRFLSAAIRVGRRQLGRARPNPAVGCLIVNAGRVVGIGATGKGGRPHGETIALGDAGKAASGATAYVSLEPCNHYGKTGPCTEALIDAGVARVVIALGDPDPRVSGSGAARLREAGLDVLFEPFTDIRSQAQAAHRGHIIRMCKGRPHITLKLALSADGGIGREGQGEGQGQMAITGPLTNSLMHGLRSRMDAIAIGAGTYRADHPKLTVRLPGLEHRSPQRVVLGGADAPEGFIHLPGSNLGSSFQTLSEQGTTQVLVEGGAKIAQSLLREGLVDELILLQGKDAIGKGAIRPFPANPFDSVVDAGLEGWTVQAKRALEADRMMVLAPPA